jgi:type IV pilus assembly protein PilW
MTLTANAATGVAGSGVPPARFRRHVRGVTLVDVLVGLAIALFAIVVVYQSFVVIQTIRRSVSAVADAHAAAVFALETIAIAAASAGAGIAQGAPWFDACPVSADVATTLRPVSLLITDGGRADRPDALVVRQSLAVSAPLARFVAAAPAGAPFRIEAADGFAVGDRLIAASDSGQCVVADITGVTSAGAGAVDIAHTSVATDLAATSVALNLGPAGRAATARYDVVAGTLRSTNLGNGDAPNPLVSNVVNLKLQYGIDSDGDGVLDTWVGADAASPAYAGRHSATCAANSSRFFPAVRATTRKCSRWRRSTARALRPIDPVEPRIATPRTPRIRPLIR